MTGYYKMHRGWMDNDVFEKVPYTQREAWEWMISEARWKDETRNVLGNPVTLRRGEFTHAIRFMADKFGWTKAKLEHFLNKLKKFEMIRTDNKTGQLVVTICNYEEYQFQQDTPQDAAQDTSRTRAGHEQDKVEERKEREEGKEYIPPTPRKGVKVVFTPPDWLPEKPWQDFCEHRKTMRKPMSVKAMDLTVKELDRLRQAGNQPEGVLNQSIQRGWQGIFEINKGDKNAKSSNNQFHAAKLSKSDRARAAIFADAGPEPASAWPAS